MARAKQPVSIDGVEFDALIDSDESLESDIPDYPVETGFMVSDTIIIRPKTLSLTLFVTDTPVTWKLRHGGIGRTQDVRARLKDVYYRKDLVTVVTTDETYKDMGIESIRFPRTKEDGTSYRIPISLKQVQKTQTRTVGIPAGYGKSGSTGASAGSSNFANAGSGGTSAAYNRGFALMTGGLS